MKWVICLAVVLTVDSLKLENQDDASVLSDPVITKKQDKQLDANPNWFRLLGRAVIRAGISSATGAGIGAAMGDATFAKNDSTLRGAVTGLTGAVVGSIVGDAVVMFIDRGQDTDGGDPTQNVQDPARAQQEEQMPTVSAPAAREAADEEAMSLIGVNDENQQLCKVNEQAREANFLRRDLMDAPSECRLTENKCINTKMFAYFVTSSSTNKIVEEVALRISDLEEKPELKKDHLRLVKAANIMFITYISKEKVQKLLAVSQVKTTDGNLFSWFLSPKSNADLACIYFLGSIHSLIQFTDQFKYPESSPQAPRSKNKRPLIKEQLDIGIRFFDVRLFGEESLRGYDPTSLKQKWGSHTWYGFWDEMELWCKQSESTKSKTKIADRDGTPIFIRVEPKTEGAQSEFIKQLESKLNQYKKTNKRTLDYMMKLDAADILPTTKVSQLMNRQKGWWVGSCRIVILASNWYVKKDKKDAFLDNYWTLVTGYPTNDADALNPVTTERVLQVQNKSYTILQDTVKVEGNKKTYVTATCKATHKMFVKKFMDMTNEEYTKQLDKRKYDFRTTRSTEFW